MAHRITWNFFFPLLLFLKICRNSKYQAIFIKVISNQKNNSNSFVWIVACVVIISENLFYCVSGSQFIPTKNWFCFCASGNKLASSIPCMWSVFVLSYNLSHRKYKIILWLYIFVCTFTPKICMVLLQRIHNTDSIHSV